MKAWRGIYPRVILILLLLLIPIVAFNIYTDYTNTRVIEEELENRNLNRLSLVQNQIDANFNQMSMLLQGLNADPTINEFKSTDIYSDYQVLKIKQDILEKLYFQKGLSSWSNDYSVFSMRSKEILKTSSSQEITEAFAREWEYRESSQNDEAYFIKHLTQPNLSVLNGGVAELVIEARLPVKRIISFLEQLKLDQFSDPFMYHPDNRVIITPSTNYELINEIISEMSNQFPLASGNLTTTIDKNNYLISYMKSDILDWIIIDYTLLQEVMMPVAKNKKLFYMFITVLLVLGMIATYLLYRNIQIPIKRMVDGIQQIKDGNYSVRVEPFPNNEFNFMMESFNEMSKQIETLIEVVHKEELRYQDAHVKQLQSQINPHFLYNCLFIMKSMAKLGNYKGVEAMSLHLGKYYRYMTKVEDKFTTIGDELEFIRNYLEIHVLRMQRLTYKINVPKEMLDISIPRLLIQPIVENASVHGVGTNLKEGIITITGSKFDGGNCIIIEDNGTGLSSEDINKMSKSVSNSEDSNSGLWNVHKRLLYHFNDQAGLEFYRSELGGLRVTMYWKENFDNV